MAEAIELDPVDVLAAGAVGEPGAREFYIQARKEAAQITVLVEKEQIALLAAEAASFLDRVAADFPDAPIVDPGIVDPLLNEPAVPLFRARMIGLGYDPERAMVLIELRERGEVEEGPEGDEGVGGADDDADEVDDDDEGFVARLYATRAQVLAMCERGASVVAAGRPPCPLCEGPMDPSGHVCPRWN
jgi:uncharacterized repeat protein (TIGR03847 family)